MPLDGQNFVLPDVSPATAKEFRAATPRERLRMLRDALRMEMPEQFEWDYAEILSTRHKCGTRGCAMGLAAKLWPEQFTYSDIPHTGEMQRIFGLSGETARDLFLEQPMHSTAAQVADAIDRYLAKSVAALRKAAEI